MSYAEIQPAARLAMLIVHQTLHAGQNLLMAHPLLTVYFALNLLIAMVLHAFTLRRDFYSPHPLEVSVYFVVMLAIGTPLFLLVSLFAIVQRFLISS